jgi:hypothetical protein
MEVAQSSDPDLSGTDAYWNYGVVSTDSTDFTTDAKNKASNSAWTATRYPKYADWRTFKTYRMVWSSSELSVYQDGTLRDTCPSLIPAAPCYIWLQEGNAGSMYVDYVLVRTYSATPPAAITFSGEQETAAPPVTPTISSGTITVSSSIRPRASATIPTLSTDLKDDLIDSLGGETVPEPGNDTINWTGLISTIGGAYTSILGPLAYTLIFSIPFLMMWITQRDMTLPGLVGALFGLFIIVRLPAEFHLVAVTFIVISIVAVIYSLVKERV